MIASRATIGLSDSDAPTSTVVGGSLAGGGSVRGVGQLSFRASDAGAGVYRKVLAVDGTEVARQVVDGNGGACADVEPSNGDPYEFGTPQPCPLEVSGDVRFDTATLHDGAHAIRVSVEDAAGNPDIVYDGVVSTHNAPVGTVAPALAGEARVGAQLTAGTGQWDGAPTGFGYRWLRCEGDGTSCAGIAGANGSAYTLSAADAYHRIIAEVTAENGSGAAVTRTAASNAIADAAGHTAPPGAVDAPQAPHVAPTALPPLETGGIHDLANPQAPATGHARNGANAAEGAKLSLGFRLAHGRTAGRVRSGRNRRWVLVGRLVDRLGSGIGGARLGAAWRVDGRAWVAHSGVRTKADGRFTYTLPPGPSRAVELTYFAFADSRSFRASNVVWEDVLSPLTIRADRRRVSGTRVVRLSGRVGGGPIPRGGVLVALEGYQRGFGWRTFRTVRTTRGGLWSTRYRFRLTHGRFGFRAVVPRQGGYPFLTSRSAGVYVTVS